MTPRPGNDWPTGAARFSEPETRERRGFSTVAAVLALLALIAGVPALLIALAGPVPRPASWPSLNDLANTITFNQVLIVIVIVVWLAWLQFLVCVAVEVVAALRGGVLAVHIPLSGPSQRLARLLVATVLLAGTVVGQVSVANAAVAPIQASTASARTVATAAPFSSSDQAASAASLNGTAPVATSRSSRHTSAQVLAAAEAVERRAAADQEQARVSPAALGQANATVIDKNEQALDGHKVYAVEAPAGRHHDSLWAIAERHLGDGRRYQEIYRLNEGRMQPDGQTLHLSRLIQPGWRLVMPEDAVGVPRYVADRSAPAPESDRTTTTPAPAHEAPATHAPAGAVPATQAPAVSAPATRVPVAPAATPAVHVAAHLPAGQAPTATGALPEIRGGAPGAQVAPGPRAAAKPSSAIGDASATRVPTAPSSAPALDDATPPAGTAQTAPRPAGQRPVVQESPSQQSPSQQSPSRQSAPQQPGTQQPTGAAGPGPIVTPQVDATHESDLSVVNPLGFELIGAGLLAAALLGALLMIRRRRGTTAEADPEDANTEVWLRTGADADRGALLDLALRSLSRSCRDVGRQLPQAYGAVVDDDGLDLLLTMSHPSPPPPWAALDEGLRWRVTYADAQHLVPDSDSAYPLLASVGRDPQGRDALINLGAAAGPVAVVGSPAMAAAVVRALALGLAGNPWSRGIEVLTADLPATLPAISAGRLVPCAGARDLTEQLEQGSGRMPRTGPIQILTGGPAPGSRPEQVAIYGAPLNAPIAQRLQALIVRRTELAVLVTGELPGAAWRLKVDDAGNLSCDELSLNVTANRLGDGSVERLHALFISASTVGPRPGMASAERVVDDAGVVETDDVTWAQAAVRIAILGEVEVRAPGMIEASRLPLFGEIVAYLALHPAGAHPTVLASAIWPRGVTSDVRDGTLSQVRDWLGNNSDGQPRIREGGDGRMRLSPDVPCDWDVLRTLVNRANLSGDVSRERDLLIRALHLVRGPVVGGITHGTYTWLPRTDLERQAEGLIVDAAARLSQLCADEGDQVAVEQAAAAGLRAVPEAQHLWRHIIRAEHALGGPARLARVTEHLRFALATSGVDLEPETQALIEHLSSVSTGSASA